MASASELIKRRMQRSMAYTNNTTRVDYSYNYMNNFTKGVCLKDACCNTCPEPPVPRDRYKIAFINPGGSAPPSYTPLEICTLLNFMSPILIGQTLTLLNLTGQSMTYYLGNGPAAIPIAFVSYTDGILPDDEVILPSLTAAGNSLFYFTDGVTCPGS
jgi:hypothetical protein